MNNRPDTESISQKAFDLAMDAFFPFEDKPHIAIAVSGGRDSMALCLLLKAWVENQGGRLLALTVDHGLRASSSEESNRVAAWMKGLGIEHHILPWEGQKPASGIQEAARNARYALMEKFCKARGILYLVLGHHRDDQQETYRLRAERKSGPDGLAAMASVVETRYLRLLRPLLMFSRLQITATLEAANQPWIDDPSNEDRKYARARLRQEPNAEPTQNIARHRRDRNAREAEMAALLALTVSLHPLGFAEIHRDALSTDRRTDLFAQVITTVGGGRYKPRSEHITRLSDGITNNGPGWRATLGRCVISLTEQKILICRENRNLPEEITVGAGQGVFWDRRFKIMAEETVKIAALGVKGRALLKADGWEKGDLPLAALNSLPALWDENGVLAAPLLGYKRGGLEKKTLEMAQMVFTPSHPLLGSGLRLA